MKTKKGLLSKGFWRDDKWAHSHSQELAKKYPNQWIAVVNKKVVSAGEDLAQLERETVRRTARKEFPLIFVERGAHVYND